GATAALLVLALIACAAAAAARSLPVAHAGPPHGARDGADEPGPDAVTLPDHGMLPAPGTRRWPPGRNVHHTPAAVSRPSARHAPPRRGAGAREHPPLRAVRPGRQAQLFAEGGPPHLAGRRAGQPLPLDEDGFREFRQVAHGVPPPVRVEAGAVLDDEHRLRG